MTGPVLADPAGPGPVLLTGSGGDLLAHLAAAVLARAAVEVVVAPVPGSGPAPSDLRAAVRSLLRACDGGQRPGTVRRAGRLRCLGAGEPVPDGPAVQTVWCITTAPLDPDAAERDAAHLDALLAATPRCAGAQVAHLTATMGAVTGPAANGRIRIPLPRHDDPDRTGADPGAGLTALLDSLDDLFGVLADRIRDADRRPHPEAQASADHPAPGISVAQPAALADALVHNADPAEAGVVVPVTELVQAAAQAHRPDPDPGPRVTSAAVGELAAVMVAGWPGPLPKGTGRGGGVVDGAARARRQARAGAIRQDALRARACVERRQVLVHGGYLEYTATGTGPPLVVLEALGHDLVAWRRLIGRLAARRRVLAWVPRTHSGDTPALLTDQVDDLDAVLGHEGIHRCPIVGWCTGPKVALAWEDRHPGKAAALVLLNPSFRVAGRPDVPDTPHEHNLEMLCRSLVRRPQAVSALRRMISPQVDATLPAGATEQPDRPVIDRILASAPAALAEAVRRPFASDESLLAYAAQLVDFWDHDVLAGPRPATPTLVISGDHDTVTTPEALQTALARLPHAEHRALPGGSHYLLHDRADSLAHLVHAFLDRTVGPGQEPASTARRA